MREVGPAFLLMGSAITVNISLVTGLDGPSLGGAAAVRAGCQALRLGHARAAHDGRELPQERRPTVQHGSMVKVPWLTAAEAATHHSRSPTAGSGLTSGPERRALAAWVPKRACVGALVPAQSRRLHCL